MFKPRLQSWKDIYIYIFFMQTDIDDVIQTQQIINKIGQTPKMGLMGKTWDLMKAVETQSKNVNRLRT